MNACYPCTINAFHPWHDNGTVNEGDMQTVIGSLMKEER